MTPRRSARTATTAGVLALGLTGLLAVGCDRGSSRGAGTTGSPAPTSSVPRPSAPPSVPAVPAPVTRLPAPTSSAVTRLVVHAPGDPTSVTVDVPPARDGYVVVAGCDGRPGTSVSWTAARTVGPVGDTGSGAAPCDGAGHTAAALAGGPVAVQVRLSLTVDLSAVSSAWAVLQPAP